MKRLALALTLTPAIAAAQDSVTYTLSPRASELAVVIRSDPSATLARLGHDHVIVASDFAGVVTWPTAPGGPCSVRIEVPIAKLVVDPPGSREKAGLDGNTINDDDKGKLLRNLESSGQVDAARNPVVRFVATSCPGGSGAVPVAGELTLRGKSVPVTVTMQVAADAGRFTASGKLQLTHTQFGFKPFSATAFGPRNLDAMTLTVRVQGAPTP